MSPERTLMVVVPDVGFELTTDRLQGGCSTTELIRLQRNIHIIKLSERIKRKIYQS